MLSKYEIRRKVISFIARIDIIKYTELSTELYTMHTECGQYLLIECDHWSVSLD